MNVAIDRWDRLAIDASLSAHGFLRRSPWRDGGRPGHREWLHFTVHAGDLRLVINASVVDDLRPAAARHQERARLLVLVHDGTRWHGGVDDVADAQLRGGQLEATLGDVTIAGTRSELTIRGALRQRPIELDLTFVAETFPSIATGVSIGDSPPINWLVVPRLRVSGRVIVEGREYAFDDGVGYHDHNWGYFSHHDFAWQWGHSAGHGPYSVVLARLVDAAHASVFMQSLLVWRGPRQARVFRGGELDVAPRGHLRPHRPLTVPNTAALLVENLATEVPERLEIAARSDGDELAGAFECKSLARVVVPFDDSMLTTVIHEVEGRLHLRGTLHGEAFELDAPGMFEFLRSVS